MTDRVHSLTVALEKDMRVDDAEALISAISMLRGVLKVEGNITEPGEWAMHERVRREIGEALWAVLYPKAKP